MFRNALFLVVCVACALGRPEKNQNDEGNDIKLDNLHVIHNYKSQLYQVNAEEQTADYWIAKARETVQKKRNQQRSHAVAKNVIMFIGDGMSIPTLAASRIHLGQRGGKPGEDTELSFEKFPNVGLSKTYCVDRQVADSACSATAYLCGVKTNEGTIGVTAAVPLGNCEAMQDPINHIQSIARLFQLKGRRTGIVSTTRVTHASPAAVYAHTAHRDWESDTDVKNNGGDPLLCHDIAQQLITGETGKELNVILGGGRAAFLPKTVNDEEGSPGERSDGRHLINEWKKQMADSSKSHKYVSKTADLLNLPNSTEYVLGLFSSSHLDFNLDRKPEAQPSLQEMTEAAIKVLSQDGSGYFLFVEGGRIDQAHHKALARKALDETIELHKAVESAVALTNEHETLIVVTSDHAHTMSINGYPARGNDILGIGGRAKDDLPYTTISYANGPGYRKEVDGNRHDVSKDNLLDNEYSYVGLFPGDSETHGGDDVAIFAKGPWSHLFNGVMEQNVIPHAMAYAACVVGVCDHGNAANLNPSIVLYLCALFVLIRQGIFTF